MPKTPSAEYAKQVTAWNKVNSVGAAVVVRLLLGGSMETVTAGPAYQLFGTGTAAIRLAGLGVYLLERVKSVEVSCE